MIEFIIAIGVMVVASGLFLDILLSTSTLRRVNRERAEATEAAWTVLEAMRHEHFLEIFPRFNADPRDDPEGEGTAPGHRFRVEGLSPLEDAPDETVGTIVFPELVFDEEESRGQSTGRARRRKEGPGVQFADVFFPGSTEEITYFLREDYVNNKLGMPRDLNGDNVVDTLDHGADYVLLPVCIRLEWQGSSGPTTFEIYTMFGDSQPHSSTNSSTEEDWDLRFRDFWEKKKAGGKGKGK